MIHKRSTALERLVQIILLAHSRSLVSAFVIHCLKNERSLVSAFVIHCLKNERSLVSAFVIHCLKKEDVKLVQCKKIVILASLCNWVC